jgi:histidinol-phosphate/aromatic aminotransferase/cobyric acid decarboxylase-like protein
MKHEDFLALRDGLRAQRPALLDLSELNLYRSLAPRFPAIAPSTHHEAPYRCHVAERFLEQLALPASLKPRTQVSHGVRRSLGALFKLFAARRARVAVPQDVYPVYLQLAAEAKLDVVTYRAQLGLPDEAALQGLDALLVCEPLKPWGTPQDGAALEAWATSVPGRVVLVDSAYATPPTSTALRLLEADVAMLLASCSKGWLIPDHAGVCVVPRAWQGEVREAFSQLPKDEARLRIGYAALSEHVQRPRAVHAELAARAQQLDALTRQRPELGAQPCVGYFATSSRSFSQLLELGVLATPASVFGGRADESVLSSLAPAPRA